MYIPKTEYYELPTKYNKTIVRLLVQSPNRMFAYWQVSDEFIKHFNSKHSNYSICKPVLKITNLTLNYSYSLPVDPFTNNYYIDVKDPDCVYQVEIGRSDKNEFINIYTSNTVQIPRSCPVPISYEDEVIYRNYIKLDLTDKFTIYYRRRNHNLNPYNNQDYNLLSFTDNSSSFNGGISSFSNISSFSKYDN